MNDQYPEKAKLRPQVAWFANLMEEILRKNDYKGGWNECSTLWLLAKLSEEVGELGEILTETHFPDGSAFPPKFPLTAQTTQQICNEAADIANIAMMIATNTLNTLHHRYAEYAKGD